MSCPIFSFGTLAVIAIDTMAVNSLLSIPKRGGSNASILYEVPGQKGNEGHQKDNHEKWQAGNSGCVPCVWNQDVQNWQVDLLLKESNRTREGWISPTGSPALLFYESYLTLKVQ
jgi:hypothetical protein